MNVISSDDKDETELDPRIQIELENLNNKTDAINKLEMDLEKANAHFRRLLNDSTECLKDLSKKLGACIARARPYHEAVAESKQAQLECQKAALQFQRASEMHRAAKETVALAEQRFMSKHGDWAFDSAWQDMLNHATIKVAEAEHQKAASEQEHKMKAAKFCEAEKNVQLLEAQQRRSIARSQVYFTEKEVSDRALNEQKTLIENLQKDVAVAKQEYAAALRRLEAISDEIHCKRAKGPREPGVGAELIAEIESEVASSQVPKHCISESTENQPLCRDENNVEELRTRTVEGESCIISST